MVRVSSIKQEPVKTKAEWQEIYGSLPNKLSTKNLSISYKNKRILDDINVEIKEHEIFGLIGPANSGKTSFLKALNRMELFNPMMCVKGDVHFSHMNIRSIKNEYELRSRIGVVFPLPVGLPLSVYDNVAFAPRLKGIKKKSELDDIVEQSLQKAALWDEVKDRLKTLGSLLSGGQQQRLTIARALSQSPEVLILDEFSIAIDPVTTMRIEAALKDLKKQMTIILVSNLVQQAHRLADRTAFFLKGKCLEVGITSELFEGQVQNQTTHDYIMGKFG